jgi:hypothetical protein
MKEDTLHRLRLTFAALIAALAILVAAGPAAAAKVHVALRVEGPSRTVFAGRPVPLTGTVQGHRLAQPTPLGALLTASHNHRFGVGLTWFSCCGFFVDSVAGKAGDASHFWAFKVGHALSSLGAGSIKATPGMHALFYWTTFDPNTGATEPTLGLKATSRSLEPGAAATFTVASYDDAGTGTPAAHAWVSVNGAATQAGSLGRVTVRFTRTGTYAVRATLPGAIRSPTVWVHVGSS